MTAAFVAAYLNYNGRELFGLLELQLPAVAGGTDVLYVATSEVMTPAGGAFARQLWQKGAAFGSLRAPGAFATNEVAPCTFGFTLEDRTYAYASGATATLDEILRAHYVQGAVVVARWWLGALADFADAAICFPGEITEVECRPGQTTFACKQRDDWNRDIVVKKVNKIDDPNADEGAIGEPIPWRWGSIKGVPLIVPPFENAYGANVTGGTTHLRRELCHGVRGTAKCLLVDVGRGATATKGKVLAAAHKIKSLGVPATGPWGTSIGFLEAGRLSLYDAASGDVFLDSAGSGFYVPDSFDQVYAPVYPVDAKAVGGSSPGIPRAVLDPYSTSYCRIDQTNKKVDYALPSLENLGEANAIGLVVGYRTSGGAAALKAQLYTGSGASVLTLAASTTIRIAELVINTPPIWDPTIGTPATPYDFTQSTLRVYFDAGSAGTADIFLAGVWVRHKAGRRIVVSGQRVLVAKRNHKPARQPWGRRAFHPHSWEQQLVGEVSEANGQFFANLEGFADDGEFDTAGEFTGEASGTLIERAPDIAQHALVACGQEDPAKIERGTSVHGSFEDARARLLSWRKRELPYAFKVSTTTSLNDMLHELARDSVSWIFLSHLDDKWKFVPWDPAAPVNFRAAFSRDDLGPPESFVPKLGSASDVLTAISIHYLHDDQTDGYLYESACSREGSLAGYEFLNQRDQSFVVVAGYNDKVDFLGTLIGSFTATIAPGSYDSQGIIAAVRAALVAQTASDLAVGLGATVKSGANDKFYYNDGANKNVTLAAGTTTMDARAAELQGLLGAGYTVTYSRATGKFTLTKSAGTFQLKLSATDSCAAMLGFETKSYTGSLSYTSDAGVEEELFVLSSSIVGFELRWRTGTNGWEKPVATDIKTAAPLLGYLPSANSAGAHVYTAFSPRGEREAVLDLAARRSGDHPRLEFTSESIRSGETAREVRNRIVDLMSKPRVVLQFTTNRAPDLERGHVITFASDLDGYYRAFPEPGSDGLWAGRRLVVVEIEHSLGPQTCATKVVAVSLG